jgi:hypothetical protein
VLNVSFRFYHQQERDYSALIQTNIKELRPGGIVLIDPMATRIPVNMELCTSYEVGVQASLLNYLY